MSKESKETNKNTCIHCVAEVPEVPMRAYKAGSFIKWLLHWTKEVIEALHEGAESYMIALRLNNIREVFVDCHPPPAFLEFTGDLEERF